MLAKKRSLRVSFFLLAYSTPAKLSYGLMALVIAYLDESWSISK
jgi:hypothetical protein